MNIQYKILENALHTEIFPIRLPIKASSHVTENSLPKKVKKILQFTKEL